MTLETKRAVAHASSALAAAILADMKADLYTDPKVPPKVGDVVYVNAGDDHNGGLGRVIDVRYGDMVTTEQVPGYSFSWRHYGPKQFDFAQNYGNKLARTGYVGDTRDPFREYFR